MTAWRKFASRPKYGNEMQSAPCAYGFSHRSRLEASVCQLLALRERSGEIAHVQHEEHVEICGPEGHECGHKKRIEYVADFRFTNLKAGTDFRVEAKGMETPTFALKLRLYRHYGDLPLEIWKGHWRNPKLVEVINVD